MHGPFVYHEFMLGWVGSLEFHQHSAPCDEFHYQACCQELGEEFFLGKRDTELSTARLIPMLFTNRSGSNYVAELIGSSKIFNLASEVFNSEEVIRICKEDKISSLSEYAQKIIAHNAIGNTFFVKLATPHLFMLERGGLLSSIFSEGKAIWSRRSDLIAQSISFFIAEKTGRWASYQEGGVMPLSGEDYDFSQISYFYDLVSDQERRLIDFIAANRISCLDINYERLCFDPMSAMSLISSHLEIGELKPDFASVKTARQSGELNLYFAERFSVDLLNVNTQS
jgi:LPS sulfotransferase NodH